MLLILSKVSSCIINSSGYAIFWLNTIRKHDIMQKKLQNVLHTFFYYRKNGKIKKNARNKKKNQPLPYMMQKVWKGGHAFFISIFLM